MLSFHIHIYLKTAGGFEKIGSFDLGTDKGFANDLFHLMEGRDPRPDEDLLHIDLVERLHGLPLNIRAIGCTVDELARNVKTITREIFKVLNLNGSHMN